MKVSILIPLVVAVQIKEAPSSIIVGQIPDSTAPAKSKRVGPTDDYAFSSDKDGPHKVEVFRAMTI